MRAFRHSKLLKACTAANRFALLTSAYIWPGGHIYCSALAIASKLALLSASAYIRLHFACRIYCCASAEQMEPPCRILFGDICVPHGTHSCSRPALQQTSLQRQFSLILDLVTFPFVQKYECALRHMTSIRSLHNCKLVCIVCDFS